MNALSVKKAQQGFTLIELMIVVAIIGILASIALPAYKTYTMKSRFTEVVMAASAPKTAVEVCAQIQGLTAGAVTGCGSGSNGVPVDLGTLGNIKSVTTTNAGVVTAVANNTNGFVGTESYILTPTVDANGKITWAITGTCLGLGYC